MGKSTTQLANTVPPYHINAIQGPPIAAGPLCYVFYGIIRSYTYLILLSLFRNQLPDLLTTGADQLRRLPQCIADIIQVALECDQ